MKRTGIWQMKGGIALLAAFMTALLTFGGISSAAAQIAPSRPTWVVVDFVDAKGGNAGTAAADAFGTELSKDTSLDVLPVETGNRAMDDLGLRSPLNSPSDLSRLGQRLLATTIVTGEVKNYRVIEVDGSKQAQVTIRVFVKDTAAGISVNGAAVSGKSGLRPVDTPDDVLMNEAFEDAAFKAVKVIRTRNIPRSTVLNTLNDRALIDKGSRDGMTKGMEVLVLRGSELVARGRIIEVDADSSYVRPTESYKGVRTGDKVRAIFQVPDIQGDFGKNGEPVPVRERSSGNNDGLVTVVLVLLLLGLLLGQGRAGSTDLVADVRAEPTYNLGQPAVKLSWKRDSFLRGNQEGPVRWHVWRHDVFTTPVAVVPASMGTAIDDAIGSQQPSAANPWSNIEPNEPVTLEDCVNEDPADDTSSDATPLISGQPYLYSVQVIYRVAGSSLPGDGGTGGGGGGTGGGGTGGGGTGDGGGGTGDGGGGTGDGGGGGGAGGRAPEYCYFASTRVAAVGQATSFVRPPLQTPINDQIVTTPIKFSFDSVRGPDPAVQIEYVLQVSTAPDFHASRTITLDPFVELVAPGGTEVSTPVVDVPTLFPGEQRLYWRIGAKNIEDAPGPVMDSSGKRYIWSVVRTIRRSVIPPQPEASN